VLLIRRTVRPRGYALGSSLAAALLNSLFEQPAGSAGTFRDFIQSWIILINNSFSASC
jgi:hypothetical protein